MVVVNYSDFRRNLKENLDIASDDKEIVIVSRSHNKNVVIISLDEYNSWQETNYLLRSENNRQRLREAIEDTRMGKFESHDLVENQ